MTVSEVYFRYCICCWSSWGLLSVVPLVQVGVPTQYILCIIIHIYLYNCILIISWTTLFPSYVIFKRTKWLAWNIWIRKLSSLYFLSEGPKWVLVIYLNCLSKISTSATNMPEFQVYWSLRWHLSFLLIQQQTWLLMRRGTQRSMPTRMKQQLLSLSWRVMLLLKVIQRYNAIIFQLNDDALWLTLLRDIVMALTLSEGNCTFYIHTLLWFTCRQCCITTGHHMQERECLIFW